MDKAAVEHFIDVLPEIALPQCGIASGYDPSVVETEEQACIVAQIFVCEDVRVRAEFRAAMSD